MKKAALKVGSLERTRVLNWVDLMAVSSAAKTAEMRAGSMAVSSAETMALSSAENLGPMMA